MQDRPLIRTAIPKHRYQLGDYAATLLGEIESGDHRSYRYILAFVALGRKEPELYVWAEPTPAAESTAGAYRLRVVSEALSEVVDSGDRWGDLESFAAQALKLGAQALGLQREQVVQLM
jgi:hypothetical protein